VTGLGDPVMWAVYITNFVFWVGITHSGTLISDSFSVPHALAHCGLPRRRDQRKR
jgi:hypothetical protein